MRFEVTRQDKNLLEINLAGHGPSKASIQSSIDQFTAEIGALDVELESYQNGRRIFSKDERGEYVDDTPGRVASIERSQNALSGAIEMLRCFVSDMKS